LNDLKLISRTSSQKYKSDPDNLREIAKQLRVANVLEGTVQKSRRSSESQCAVDQCTERAHLWRDVYDRKPRLSDCGMLTEWQRVREISGIIAFGQTARRCRE